MASVDAQRPLSSASGDSEQGHTRGPAGAGVRSRETGARWLLRVGRTASAERQPSAILVLEAV